MPRQKKTGPKKKKTKPLAPKGKNFKGPAAKRGRPKIRNTMNNQVTERKFRAPVAAGSIRVNRTPTGVFRVRRTEFLQQVVGTVAFTAVTYNVQPASIDNFPWLGSLALNFEQYKFRSLKYEFKAACPTSTTGKLMMVTQHDVGDPIPGDQFTMLNYDGSQSGSPWHDQTHNCMMVRGNWTKKLFMLPDGATATGGVNQIYNAANFTYSTIGQTAGDVLGDLYVHYDVDLFNPKQPQAVAFTGGIQYQVNGTTAVPIGTVISDNKQMPTDMQMVLANSGSNDGSFLLRLPAIGEYLCSMYTDAFDAKSGDLPLYTASSGVSNLATTLIPSVSTGSGPYECQYNQVFGIATAAKDAFVKWVYPGADFSNAANMFMNVDVMKLGTLFGLDYFNNVLIAPSAEFKEGVPTMPYTVTIENGRKIYNVDKKIMFSKIPRYLAVTADTAVLVPEEDSEADLQPGLLPRPAVSLSAREAREYKSRKQSPAGRKA